MKRSIDGFALTASAMKGEAHDFWFGVITVERGGRRITHRFEQTFFRTRGSAEAYAMEMVTRVDRVDPDHALRFAPRP